MTIRPTALTLLLLAITAVRADGEGPPLVELRIGEQTVEAELAITAEARRHGLMERQRMAENRGMLLVYPRPQTLRLWMRNTPLPLSAAFIDEGGVILNIAQMAPERLDIYLSNGEAKYALEMNRGWFAERGIGPGARVEGLDGL